MNPEWRDWLQRMWQQDRSTVLRLVTVGVIGVGLVVWGAYGGSPASNGGSYSANAGHAAVSSSSPLMAEQQALDAELAAILQAIPQAGAVRVALSLSKSAVTQYQGGQSTPLDEVGPEVQGVVVVATGAANPIVREEITSAVETLLQIQPYQVLVLPNGGGT